MPERDLKINDKNLTNYEEENLTYRNLASRRFSFLSACHEFLPKKFIYILKMNKVNFSLFLLNQYHPRCTCH